MVVFAVEIYHEADRRFFVFYFWVHWVTSSDNYILYICGFKVGGLWWSSYFEFIWLGLQI